MNEPDIEQVRQRAYSLWNARGRPDGSADKDWFDAENQLKAELKGTALENTLETLRGDSQPRARRSKTARSSESSRHSADSSRPRLDSSP